MKAVELIPVTNSRFDCLESVLATLASWAERDYALLFAQTWGFRYEYHQVDSRIGQRIHSYIPQSKSFFESSSGIIVKKRNYASGEEAINYIIEETRNGRPVIVGIDSCWCPWSKLYQKQSLLHYLFVTSYIHMNDTFLCVDPFFNKNNAALPLDHYYKGFIRIMTFEIEDKIEHHSLNDVLSDTIRRLTGKDRATNSFQDMVRLANDIADTTDLKKDVEGYPVLGASPLILNTVGVAQGRLKFADYLKYSSDHYNISELTSTIEDIESLGNEWMLISAMLAKSVLRKTAGDIKNRIVEKILRIAEKEQTACVTMKALVTH